MTRPRLAYVMSRFPHLTETFILREMTALRRDGWSVTVYPLITQREPVVHPDAAEWMTRAVRLPLLSAAVVASNLMWFVRRPVRYVATLAAAVARNAPSPRFAVRTIALLPRIVHAARLMQQEGIAHVHAHYATHPGLAAWVIHRLTDIPYSLTTHSHDIFVNRTMLVPKLREAAFVVTISEYNRSFLRDHVGEWTERSLHVVRCGVSMPEKRLGARRPAPGERFEIISVGSLQRHKGFHLLIDAVRLLAAEGLRCRCRIVGEGPERLVLERAIARHRLHDTVELLGAQVETEVERLLSTAHCYVQSSFWDVTGKGEGLPVALMEALAAALPVVATSIAAIPELVADGQTGWLVAPEDPAAIAAAIRQIAADPARAAMLGQHGRDRVIREYRLEDNVRRLGELFVQAAASATPRETARQ
jgi:colanic acid/amylovoran biosynthesis glycosyltransferase